MTPAGAPVKWSEDQWIAACKHLLRCEGGDCRFCDTIKKHLVDVDADTLASAIVETMERRQPLSAPEPQGATYRTESGIEITSPPISEAESIHAQKLKAMKEEQTMHYCGECKRYLTDREEAIHDTSHEVMRVRPSAPAETREPLDRILDEIVLAVAELPDRDSPDDWPEAMLVTEGELKTIIRETLLSAAVPPSEVAELAHDCLEYIYRHDTVPKNLTDEQLRAYAQWKESPDGVRKLSDLVLRLRAVARAEKALGEG